MDPNYRTLLDKIDELEQELKLLRATIDCYRRKEEDQIKRGREWTDRLKKMMEDQP
jgi:hypothetical protein